MKRIVLISVLAALLPLSLYAQSVHSTTPMPSSTPPWPITETHFVDFGADGQTLDTQEGWDYVTVGSLMPYRVNVPLAGADMPKQEGTNFRIDYKWHFSHSNTVLNMPTTGGPFTATHPSAATAAPTMSPATPNWYTTNEVSIRMPLTPTATGSEITLAHNTRFVFNGEILCFDPSNPPADLTYRIKVVPKPSIKLTATGGATDPDVEIVACVGDDVLFPVTNPGANLVVDGYDKINVQFTLWHRPLGSTAAPTAKVTGEWLELDGKTLEFPGSLFDEVGVYTIDILNVTDRISRKSLDQVAVAATVGTDTPENGKLKVYIYPQSNSTPETMNDVQHIKNYGLL